ncbi:MAG: sulfotransferase domain-containing protein, partial [Weeksellaceae bacterium]
MSKEIYYHTGLSKTGSTFLQAQVFPRLQGIYYLPTNRYRKALRLIPHLKQNKVLVSREFDQQFQMEIVKFSKKYPNAKPIIVFREPGSWAVSNYKRFVKNGHPINFSQFIDIENDEGLFKKKDFEYSRYIQLLEENFKSKPLILMYENLKKDPEKFLNKLTDFMGIELDLSHINLSPKHVSYPLKSLQLVRAVSP